MQRTWQSWCIIWRASGHNPLQEDALLEHLAMAPSSASTPLMTDPPHLFTSSSYHHHHHHHHHMHCHPYPHLPLWIFTPPALSPYYRASSTYLAKNPWPAHRVGSTKLRPLHYREPTLPTQPFRTTLHLNQSKSPPHRSWKSGSATLPKDLHFSAFVQNNISFRYMWTLWKWWAYWK